MRARLPGFGISGFLAFWFLALVPGSTPFPLIDDHGGLPTLSS